MLLLKKLLRRYYLSKQAQTEEHADYLAKVLLTRATITLIQIALLVGFFTLWEFAAEHKIVDAFLVSRPTRVWQTVLSLHANGSLYLHVGVTSLETVIGFIGGTVIGTLLAAVLWWWPNVSRTLDPYLVVLNSLPKIALGPLFIVWLGTSPTTIVAMALAISLITTILVVHSGFQEVDPLKLKLVNSFGATKWQAFKYIVLPGSLPTILSALKVNVGLSWVGVIVGEFLVSRAGLGYLAIYGGQVLNMHLVMTSVLLLAVAAAVMYQLVVLFEKKIVAHHQ
ncbi:MAG: nitrate/sulfonate/bicarbonate ABC transporter permease [Bacillota bacterium]|nr:MAG: nitrate/sulfonate/bicarbonate ABC transporter permease [Bacillota bacterium]